MEEKRNEVLEAVRNSLADGPEMVGEIRDVLLNCADKLRVEPAEDLFNTLSGKMDNLSDLMDFIRELGNGLEFLNISTEPLSCWEKSLAVFQEMLSAFENKDWITLADIIQYELAPLLSEGERGLQEMVEGVASVGDRAE